MEHYFLCPKCRARMLLPDCSVCGYSVPVSDSIYRFCDGAAVKLEGEKQYIGYDNIGEDFEPEVVYWDANHVERYGVYAACGELIARRFGTDICVLDLGAGLGSAAIPLAKCGVCTIAADISAVMLGTAAKRAGGRFDNLVLAQMNAYELMLPDGSVDIVVENAMLHLVDEPEAVIREIVRVLKPNGKLIRYASPGLPLTAEEKARSRHCNRVLDDITDCYYRYLEEHHYRSTVFQRDCEALLERYFAPPVREVAEGFAEVFTDKMKFRLHRLRTGAHSDLQGTPKALLDSAWRHADQYARGKYGEDYAEIKGFARYGAAVDVYTVLT